MRNATLSLDFSRELGQLDMRRMSLGQGGLSSDPMWEQRIQEVRALRPGLFRFWIQEYFNVLPEVGRYDFAKLDRALEVVIQTGATPLVSLNLKPRVLFPTIDERNMTPADWAAWEDLILTLVKRYVDRGHSGWYWEVGGETDQGEGGGCPYLADVTSYIPFYEHTVRAVLKADPNARVGGAGFCHLEQPFMAEWLDWCVKSAGHTPVHFVSWHIYSNEPLAIRGTIDHVRELLSARPTLKCETILDEWNMSLDFGSGHTTDQRFQPCFIPEVIWHMLDAGLDHSCYYHIRDYHVNMDEFLPFFTHRGAAFMARWWNRMPQADGLFDYQNVIRPAYFSYKLLSRMSGQRLHATTTDPQVHAILIRDPIFKLTNLLFWNFSPEPVDLKIEFQALRSDQNLLEMKLDAESPSSDENHRIRQLGRRSLSSGNHSIQRHLDPFAVHFWCLHGKSWDISD